MKRNIIRQLFHMLESHYAKETYFFQKPPMTCKGLTNTRSIALIFDELYVM